MSRRTGFYLSRRDVHTLLKNDVDEVVPTEVRELCDLFNAICVDNVSKEIGKLRTEKCCGCKVDHPSQRRHECLMMSEEEGWEMHGVEAIRREFGRGTIWKKFNEAVRVLKLTQYPRALEHYCSLKKNYTETLGFLLKVKEDQYIMSKYEAIVNYLHYWILEH